MELYNYFRSSASYRVRIALALKGVDYAYKPVHLLHNEQMSESYAAVSAARLVPLLKDGDTVLTQSLAICEYLEETHPEPPLLPGDPPGRARVRALALDIACEIHPLNNLRVLRYRPLLPRRHATLADITLVPQIFNARRLDCRLDHVPTVMRVFDACMQLPAFDRTQPSACPDAS
jgi:glutathione S-transferase